MISSTTNHQLIYEYLEYSKTFDKISNNKLIVKL